MLTLRTIISATPAKIKARAKSQCFGQMGPPPGGKKDPKSSKVGGYLVDDKGGKYREFKFSVKCTDGWKRVVLRFYNDGIVAPASKFWCWCNCPYFKYNCEVALASKGSSQVVQSNGQRPRFTNPRLEPRVCKHVLLGISMAMRRGGHK